MTVKQKILSLTGMVFAVYGLILCIMSNLNLGVILVVLVGLGLVAIGVFEKKLKKSRIKLLRDLFVIALCVETVLVSFIAVYGAIDKVNYNENAVIVLGAGIRGDKVTLPLKMRLDKAAEYHRKNPDAVIVVTGGQGFQETVTEAYAMEKYLIEQGVAPDKIIKEEKATSTEENMKFSKKLLDERFDDKYSVVVVTNNFHVYRGTARAVKAGFDKVFHMHASLQWYNLIPCYLRESLAVLKMWFIG